MAMAAQVAQSTRALTANELRGEEILDILKQLRLACCAVASRSCSFIDVYSADQIPQCNKFCTFSGTVKPRKGSRPCCYRARSFIANTDPSTQPGYHWVAFVVFANRPSVIYFFDSFGMPLSNYDDLYRSCLNRGYFSDTRIVASVNSRSLQGPASTVCGHYCVLFLYLCARVSLDTTRCRVASQQGTGLSAMRLLVQATGGDLSSPRMRDSAVVRVLSDLRKRGEHLTPALACSSLGTSSAHRQCCHPRK